VSSPDERTFATTNVAWLVRLRWGAIISQIVTIAIVVLLLHIQLELGVLAIIIAMTALSNLALRLWLQHEGDGRWTVERAIACVMALDFGLLTALLYFAGGASNPFSVLYLVHVALAAAMLAPRVAWGLAVLSSASFGLLFLLPMRHDAVVHVMGMHDHAQGAGVPLHFQGMWLAFTIAAFFIVYFVTRISQDLAAQRKTAAFARAQAARSEKLASLATLAAGAAHELGTPLATIAVVSKELEREFVRVGEPAEAVEDVRLIRAEVDRCRHILAQMASDAGEGMGESFERVSLAQLASNIVAELGERERIVITLENPGEMVEIPPRLIAQALRRLLKNGLEASSAEVELLLRSAASTLFAEVRDRGPRISPETLLRIGEPFFTTKEAGRGMGLGVFLVRATLERLGGELRYESSASGTVAHASLQLGLSRTVARAKEHAP
jgi:two-component system sensor histidine kinase RegB